MENTQSQLKAVEKTLPYNSGKVNTRDNQPTHAKVSVQQLSLTII